MPIDLIDAEGATLAYLRAYPGLCGVGHPLTNGIHPAPVRSPAQGTIAEMALISPRVTDDTTDDFRMSFRVKSVGSEGAAKMTAERAARALATALVRLVSPVVVTTKAGDRVRLLVAGSIAGPTWGGDFQGQSSYLVDITVRAQPG